MLVRLRSAMPLQLLQSDKSPFLEALRSSQSSNLQAYYQIFRGFGKSPEGWQASEILPPLAVQQRCHLLRALCHSSFLWWLSWFLESWFKSTFLCYPCIHVQYTWFDSNSYSQWWSLARAWETKKIMSHKNYVDDSIDSRLSWQISICVRYCKIVEETIRNNEGWWQFVSRRKMMAVLCGCMTHSWNIITICQLFFYCNFFGFSVSLKFLSVQTCWCKKWIIVYVRLFFEEIFHSIQPYSCLYDNCFEVFPLCTNLI